MGQKVHRVGIGTNSFLGSTVKPNPAGITGVPEPTDISIFGKTRTKPGIVLILLSPHGSPPSGTLIFPVPMVRAIRMTVPRIPYGAGTTRTVPKNKQMISLVHFPFLFLTTDSPGNTSSMSPPLILVISKSLCSLIFTAMAEHPAGI